MKKIIIPLMLIGLALNSAIISSGNTATINAASCSHEHVQAAINSAFSSDIVNVPSGDCAWTAGITIPDSKKITLRGSGIDSTIIRNPLTTQVVLQVGHSASRITGFTFNEILIYAGSGEPRIDHNKFYTATTVPGSGVYFKSNNFPENNAPQGLVDNNVFYNCRVVVFAGHTLMANTQWTLPLDLGKGDHAVYVEDNEFYRTYTTCANVIDANYGGAYVFRYNTIHGINAYLRMCPQ